MSFEAKAIVIESDILEHPYHIILSSTNRSITV